MWFPGGAVVREITGVIVWGTLKSSLEEVIERVLVGFLLGATCNCETWG